MGIETVVVVVEKALDGTDAVVEFVEVVVLQGMGVVELELNLGDGMAPGSCPTIG